MREENRAHSTDQISAKQDLNGEIRLIFNSQSKIILFQIKCQKSKNNPFLLLVVCITIHEWAHAWVADKLGDPLPRQQGRVTLDPRPLRPYRYLLIPLIMIFASPGFAIIGWGNQYNALPNQEQKRMIF